MKLIAFDPGGTTGWCVMENTKRMPLQIGELKNKDFYSGIKKLITPELDLVVVEDFIIRPEYGTKWRKPDTPNKIGAIRLVCTELGIPEVLQQPSIKPVGYGWAGLVYVKGKKGTHIEDAIAHGTYYFGKKDPDFLKIPRC